LSKKCRAIRLDEVTDLIQYGYTAKSAANLVGPKYLRITDIQNDSVDWSAVPHVTIDSDDLRRYRLASGDIVFARSGATVGKSFLIREEHGDAVFASYLIRVRCTPSHLVPAYAAFYFQSDDYWQQIRDGATGMGQPNFNGTKLGELRVPIQPLEDQLLTVSTLNKSFARTRSAGEELARIPGLVERYKQAILAAAFRGDLTKDWREKHGSASDKADVLADIFAAHERSATNHRKTLPALRDQIDSADVAHLPPLPKSWAWVPVEALASKVTDGVHKKPDYVDQGIPFLTVRNLTAGPGIDFAGCRNVTEKDHLEFIKRTRPERGDILITKDGTLGVVRAIRTDVVFSIFVSLALIKPIDTNMSDYLELALSSPQVQKQMVGVGTGLQHIHLTDLRRDLIPIAPADERSQIVLRTKSLLKRVDETLSEASRAARLLNRLEKAILAKAFRGELLAV
jgi:type I restriction enzyme S subunit